MFDLSYYMPTKIIYGKNCVENNAEVFKSLGKKCLIVTGKHSAKECGALDDILKTFKRFDIESIIFDEVLQNPLLSVCKKGGQIAMENNADFIVGIGGGSPLDSAKAISVFASNDLKPIDIYNEVYENKPLPLVLIGTTAGTGSEVTPYSVLTVDETSRKRTVHNIFADLCFCDYRYTVSLNYHFSVSTALDSLSHCIESYFSPKSNTISQDFAASGIKLVYEVLDSLKDECFTDEQRQKLYAASIYGGLSITKTGTGFCHALGYYLTENFDVSHGFACAEFLPAYIKNAVTSEPKKAQKLFSEINLSPEKLSDKIKAFTTLPEVTITDEDKAKMFERWNVNGIFKNSPGNFNANDAIKLYDELF